MKSMLAVFAAGSLMLLAPLMASALDVSASAATSSPVSTNSFMACPAFARSLSIGARGDDVTELQRFLKVRGFFSVDPTGYYGPVTAAGVRSWQVSAGVVHAGHAGLGIFGPLSRAFVIRSCGVPAGSEGVTATSTASSTATSTITRINAPATVTLAVGNIAEIRNESAYFTLKSLTATTATIQTTAVGCWNWFPSDPMPEIRCMIAVMPIAPQTLSVGQTYASAKYSITLTQIASNTATFQVNASGTSSL